MRYLTAHGAGVSATRRVAWDERGPLKKMSTAAARGITGMDDRNTRAFPR